MSAGGRQKSLSRGLSRDNRRVRFLVFDFGVEWVQFTPDPKTETRSPQLQSSLRGEIKYTQPRSPVSRAPEERVSGFCTVQSGPVWERVSGFCTA
eukprot:3733380-Rhodomonas_salina.1